MYAILSRFLPKPAAIVVAAILYAALIIAVFLYSGGADAEFRYLDI